MWIALRVILLHAEKMIQFFIKNESLLLAFVNAVVETGGSDALAAAVEEETVRAGAHCLALVATFAGRVTLLHEHHRAVHTQGPRLRHVLPCRWSIGHGCLEELRKDCF